MEPDVIISMQPIVSIIIPCYNSGNYLTEAIGSIEEYPDRATFEVVIVNDGSNDEQTITLLKELEIKGYKVIHQCNKGPAAARNAGVKHASANYLLFLDSDNKIRNILIDKGVEILNTQADVGVVYGKPHFFGDVKEERKWITRPFDIRQLLIANYIDMCSMVRKSVFIEVGGFDEDRILIGHEDWELWIKIGATKWKFHFLDEITFDYRMSPTSLITTVIGNNHIDNILGVIYTKHIGLVIKYLLKEHYANLYESKKNYEDDKQRPVRSFIKFVYLKYVKPQK